MSLQYAENPYTVDWKQWFKRRFFTHEMISETPPSLSTQVVDTLLETYEVDGLDISNGEFVPAPDFENGIDYTPLRVQIFAGIISFLGLPNRLTQFRADNRFFDGITLTQFGKNLIGGWDSRPDIAVEKKILQWVALFFIKLPIILPFKLITAPLKFLLNCLKIFTEFVPQLASSLSAQGMGWFIRESHGTPDDKSQNGLRFLGLSLGIALLGVLHYSFRLITLAGRALTSPAKNVRMVLAYGRELKITVLGNSTAEKLLSNVLGGFGALLSIALTATLWIITLPLAISVISTYIPVIVQALTWVSQLPTISTLLTSLSQIPLLPTLFSAIHSPLTTLGLTLSATLGPIVSGLAGFISIVLIITF